jgi:hypothetical protein
MLEHYDEYDGTHCENYCNKINCIFKSPIQHSLGEKPHGSPSSLFPEIQACSHHDMDCGLTTSKFTSIFYSTLAGGQID